MKYLVQISAKIEVNMMVEANDKYDAVKIGGATLVKMTPYGTSSQTVACDQWLDNNSGQIVCDNSNYQNIGGRQIVLPDLSRP